ncbi:unnamed protein product [Fusarium graminearum]|nr:unnamed protein product [Fusarium graminearum]CAF3549810.1 unnamed protein product [Fusarium graminearum]CAF3581388.1 unnamed protein product [Fusarium graminearum]CAG1986868.1 unnamed protein product [Fusarium graminearum]CAG2003462.1 unnamed protein product [Fusarium graminearum]
MGSRARIDTLDSSDTPESKTQQSGPGPGGIISVRGPQPEDVIVGGPHKDSVTLPTNTEQLS